MPDAGRPDRSLRAWLAAGARLRFMIGDTEFTQYGKDDGVDLFNVRNHPSVRRFMPDPAPLDLARHLAWAGARLIGGDTLIFIARRHGQAVGFTVLKQMPVAGEIEMGVMFTDLQQRSILPALAVAYTGCVALDFFDAQVLVSYANEQHHQALRLNRGHALEQAPSDKAGELCFRTPRAALLAGRSYLRNAARVRASLCTI